MWKLIRIVVGTTGGLLAGVVVTIGVVVALATWEGHYLESTADVVGLQGLAIPVAVLLGALAGAAGRGLLLTGLAGVAGGAGIGAALGAMLGAVVGPSAAMEPRLVWVGGTVGGAAGILVGAAVVVALGRRRRLRRAEARSGREIVAWAGAAALPVLLAAFLVLRPTGTDSPVQVDSSPIAQDPAPVETVLFLVGDPGRARYDRSPILPRLAADVEARSEGASRDSAVLVLVLGDVIYPDGMAESGTPGFAEDSARVADQIQVVARPRAVERGARALFLAGNHDWGMEDDREGARRLHNLGTFLERVRTRDPGVGPLVDLVPPAGSGGPRVLDLGEHLRLVLLDTAWWIFDAEPAGKEALLEDVADALGTAGDRAVVLAAHHPFQSAGPHGGLRGFWETMGVQYVLARSGAILQDLNSAPYQDLRRRLGEIFEEHGRPLLFAGGHEHSLQLIRHDTTAAPLYSVVSGSASKLTPVAPIPGTVYQRSAPGYMKVVVRVDGAVDLYVDAAPERFLSCADGAEGMTGGADAEGGAAAEGGVDRDAERAEGVVEQCMRRGITAYRTVLSTRLRPPAEAAPRRARASPDRSR